MCVPLPKATRKRKKADKNLIILLLSLYMCQRKVQSEENQILYFYSLFSFIFATCLLICPTCSLIRKMCVCMFSLSKQCVHANPILFYLCRFLDRFLSHCEILLTLLPFKWVSIVHSSSSCSIAFSMEVNDDQMCVRENESKRKR